MRVAARLVHHVLPASSPSTTHLVVTVEGDDTNTELRPKLGIVPVVDRSGSMASARKLDIVSRALDHLSTYLGDDDQVALISFDDVTETNCARTAATPAGMALFRKALATLKPRNSTDLASGIRQGIAVAAQMAEADPEAIVRIIVLTDGKANKGERTRAALEPVVRDLPGGVTVSFIGVGYDCDHDLLGALSEAGGGSYGFVEEADRASDVLGAEIGALLTLAAANVSVTVRGRPKHGAVDAPLGVSFEEIEGSRAGGAPAFQCNLGNLAAGQVRHVVFPVRTDGPGRPHARPVTIADVEVSAVVDDEHTVEELLPKVHFRPAGSDGDDTLLEIVELAQLAEAQRTAETAAEAGRFDDAQQILTRLDVRGAASSMRDALALNYASAGVYAATAVQRRSAMAASRSSLVGSSTSFDALAARTIGTYTTSHQRSFAAETHAAVTDGLEQSWSGAEELTQSFAAGLNGASSVSDAVLLNDAGSSQTFAQLVVPGADSGGAIRGASRKTRRSIRMDAPVQEREAGEDLA